MIKGLNGPIQLCTLVYITHLIQPLERIQGKGPSLRILHDQHIQEISLVHLDPFTYQQGNFNYYHAIWYNSTAFLYH